jgi:hypothetical protein
MQSASEPNESLKLGYYLWLAAIGAIVYAYVFATSRAEMANTSLDPTRLDEATGKPIPNTGHRVITLLPFVWLYAILTKGYTALSFEYASETKFKIGNVILTLLTLVGLVFVSIAATKEERIAKVLNDAYVEIASTKDESKKATLISEISEKVNNAKIHPDIEGSERTGWVTTNIVLMGIIAVVFPLVSMRGGIANFFSNLSGLLTKASQFVFSFWFPFMMMVYLVKTGATDWFRIVAVVSIVAAIAYNLYNLYNIYIKNGLMTPGLESLKESVKYFFNTSPLLSYLRNT